MDDFFEEMLSTPGWVDGLGMSRSPWLAAPSRNTLVDTPVLGPSLPRTPAMPFMSPPSCVLRTDDLSAQMYDSIHVGQPHISLGEGGLPIGTMHLSDGTVDASRSCEGLGNSIYDGNSFQQATHGLQHLQMLAAPPWQQPYIGGLPSQLGPGSEDALDIGVCNDVCLGKRPREEAETLGPTQPDNEIPTQGLESKKRLGEQSLLLPDPNDSPGAGVVRPRVRARRGQATDPHSIAERNRRERIAERMKALQELVPDSNKTDKASMLDEIIGYVKFLQMQVKCLSMCRLGGAGVTAPLLADLPAEGADSFLAANFTQANAGFGHSQDSMAFAEGQVARLMDEDMSAAMQYLQSKGLCLMPFSLATAISSSGVRQAPPSPPSSVQPSKGADCSV